MKSLGLFLVLGASGLWAYAGSGHAVDPLADENPVVRADRARIAAHLQRVETRLRGADVSNLTPAQQERRAQALDRLRDYRQNQIFPHNHDFSNQRVPYFEDEHGTLCAMAYLIAESGRRDIVDVVRERFNNGRVVELARDTVIGPVLAAWLEENGITVTEAQAVQPAYDPPLNPSPGCGNDCVTTGYAVASGITGAASLTFIGLNSGLFSTGNPPRWAAPVGVAAGVAGMTLGVINLDKTEGALALGWVDIGVGAITAAYGLARWLGSSNQDASLAMQRAEARVRPNLSRMWDGRQQLGLRVQF